MGWLDTTLVIAIIGLILLLTWSRVMDQTMTDTLNEIKDFFSSFGSPNE